MADADSSLFGDASAKHTPAASFYIPARLQPVGISGAAPFSMLASCGGNLVAAPVQNSGGFGIYLGAHSKIQVRLRACTEPGCMCCAWHLLAKSGYDYSTHHNLTRCDCAPSQAARTCTPVRSIAKGTASNLLHQP